MDGRLLDALASISVRDVRSASPADVAAWAAAQGWLTTATGRCWRQ